MSVLSHLLIGIPASGKSTFAQHLATLINANIISTDSIRATFYGDASIQGDWNEIENEVINQIETAIIQRKSVIYDATNAKRSWRMGLLQKLGNKEIQWIAWYLSTSLETCQERNRKRQRTVPDEIIEQMYQDLKNFPPIPAEGFVTVNVVKTDRLFKLL